MGGYVTHQLRGDVDQFGVTVPTAQVFEDVFAIGGIHVGVEAAGDDALVEQGLDLVLDEGEQGRDDDGEAVGLAGLDDGG
jgi:hypothetical protein